MKPLADLIVFSDDYGRHPSSCQHLMRRFLPLNKILWVNSVGLRSPQITRRDLSRSWESLRAWLHPLKKQAESLWVYSLFSFPWNQFSVIREVNKRIGVWALQRCLQKMAFQRKVTLTTVPNMCDLIGELGEALKIYYCVDDFSQWPGMEKDLILRMEEKLLKRIDLFVAASKKLYELKKPAGIPSLLLPHAVDLEHFKQAFDAPKGVDGKLRSPKVAYFGAIDERLDFDLLEYLIHQRPHWKWVLIGPLHTLPDKFHRFKNCQIQPPISYEQLPFVLKDHDILMLPYRHSPLTQSISPLKLRECIATGKPVISRAIPEVVPYQDVVQTCANQIDFLAALDRVVSGAVKNKPEIQWKRIQNDTWEARAETLASAIESLLKRNEK